MHVLISSNGTPFEGAKGGYPGQIKHLIDIFIAGGHTVTIVMWAICGINHTGVINYRDLVENNIMSNENRDPWSQSLLDRKEVTFITNFKGKFPCVLEVDDFNECIRRCNAKRMIAIQDIFIVNGKTTKTFMCPSYIWFPLHYDPIDEPTLDALKKFDHVISLCPSTADRVYNQVGKEKIVIPHVVEFRTPLHPGLTKDIIRQRFGISNRYVIFTNSANYEVSGRKSLDTTLMAFKLFKENHPEALLWIHSNTLNQNPIYDINYLIKSMQLSYADVKVTENTVDESTLQQMYKSSDVYLCGSRAEGFGIPQLEAQYYNVPVVTTKFGAMDDYCLNGVSVPYIQRSYNQTQNAWWVMPSVEGIAEGLEKVYRKELDPQGADNAREYIMTNMSIDSVGSRILDLMFKK